MSENLNTDDHFIEEHARNTARIARRTAVKNELEALLVETLKEQGSWHEGHSSHFFGAPHSAVTIERAAPSAELLHQLKDAGFSVMEQQNRFLVKLPRNVDVELLEKSLESFKKLRAGQQQDEPNAIRNTPIVREAISLISSFIKQAAGTREHHAYIDDNARSIQFAVPDMENNRAILTALQEHGFNASHKPGSNSLTITVPEDLAAFKTSVDSFHHYVEKPAFQSSPVIEAVAQKEVAIS